ncbi:hypothetical protein BSKO_07995 [Bryopsis sp. KO-2023]|nr:hypothetical protein BSKO_07995 [Bryopsis sp. KO-2023]
MREPVGVQPRLSARAADIPPRSKILQHHPSRYSQQAERCEADRNSQPDKQGALGAWGWSMCVSSPRIRVWSRISMGVFLCANKFRIDLEDCSKGKKKG